MVLFFVVSLIVRLQDKQILTYDESEGKSATIFLIDGLSNEVFHNLLSSGRLPTIDRLISKGQYIENGIVSFPSMTGYGFYPYITGMDACNSGVLGLRWMDRNRSSGNIRNYVGRTNIQMNGDINDDYKTIYELSPPSTYTASINTYMNKGVKESVKTGWAHVTSKFQNAKFFRLLRAFPFFGKHMAKNHFEHELQVLDIALDQLNKNPKVHWITFASPDSYNHIYGTDSVYSQLVCHVDSLIGLYIQEVDNLGQSKERAIAIVSDHGVHDVNFNTDPSSYLEANTGLTISRGDCYSLLSDELNEGDRDWEGIDAHFVINGDLSGYFYFLNNSRPPTLRPWSAKNTTEDLSHYATDHSVVDIPSILKKMEAVELIISMDAKNNIIIENQGGKSIINTGEESDLISYKLVAGIDPLSIFSLGDTLPISLSKTDWLVKTFRSEFPYAIPRIFSLMSNKMASDLVITSKAGFDFGKRFRTPDPMP